MQINELRVQSEMRTNAMRCIVNRQCSDKPDRTNRLRHERVKFVKRGNRGEVQFYESLFCLSQCGVRDASLVREPTSAWQLGYCGLRHGFSQHRLDTVVTE